MWWGQVWHLHLPVTHHCAGAARRLRGCDLPPRAPCAQGEPNEAYVEGLAGTLDEHAGGGKRGLRAGEYEKEAFIHTNAPPLHLADTLIEDAIDRFFSRRGVLKPWHFKHVSVFKNSRTLVNVDDSAVMKRLRSKRARLSFTAEAME